MTQVLATADFDIEWRKYASGTVIDFADAGVIALLKSRKVIDARATAVAAAITAGATQVAHVAGKPQNTRQVGYTEDPITGVPVVSGASQGAVAGVSVAYRAAPVFAVELGDSITQGQIEAIPLSEADIGYYPSRHATANISGVIGLHFDATCANNATAVLEWDGSSRFRLAVNGDTPGAWVDVRGNGWVALLSGTNGKYVFLTLRLQLLFFAALTAQTWNVANAGTATPARRALASLNTGAMARNGAFARRCINMGIGGDRPIDILNRLPQVIALKPYVVRLMCGANQIAAETNAGAYFGVAGAVTIIPQIVAELNAAGIRVELGLTLPRAWTAAELLVLDQLNQTLIKIPNSNPLVSVTDASTPLRDASVASGNGVVRASLYGLTGGNPDYIHPSYAAVLGPVADAMDAGFKQRYPSLPPVRAVTAANIYDAVTNPKGNLVGLPALMTGTGGTKGGTTPAPTGNLPDGWSDIVGSGAYTSVTYSTVARTDKPGKNWLQIVAATASGGAATRVLFVPLAFVPPVGKRIVVRFDMQLRDVTDLNEQNASLNLVGGGPAAWRLHVLGTPPVSGATLADSGVLSFQSDPILIAPGVSAASVRFSYGCATGGSVTMRVSEVDVEIID